MASVEHRTAIHVDVTRVLESNHSLADLQRRVVGAVPTEQNVISREIRHAKHDARDVNGVCKTGACRPSVPTNVKETDGGCSDNVGCA